MNFDLAPSGWFLQSLAVGALAAAFVALCPRMLRSRVRQAVPVAAFAALLLLVAGLVYSLPTVISAPKVIEKVIKVEWADSWVDGLWVAGCALFLIRMMAGTFTVWRIVRATRPIPGRAWLQLLAECQRTLGLRGRVHLRLAGPGFVPSAAGLLRRTVLLPDEAIHWTREQRKLVLLHELGHFRRGDLWAHALGRLACALHWFNPFVWMLQRQLAVEREFAVDALVLERGATPDDYATLLFEMATASRRTPMAGAAFLTMASPRTGKLEARVQRILAPGRRAALWLRVADGAVAVALAGVLVVSASCKPTAPIDRADVEARLAADPFPGVVVEEIDASAAPLAHREMARYFRGMTNLHKGGAR